MSFQDRYIGFKAKGRDVWLAGVGAFEQIQYNMLFRWFVGLEMDDRIWHHSTFSKNRERLLDHSGLSELFASVLGMARKRQLLSEDHFSVDGTLIEA